MNQIKLSFVIPVYNVEAYLEECVNSIINQGETGIEIILVDDGSTDRSTEICDEFAQNYSCIKVVHKKNGGLSSARNAGLPLAIGKYVAFVDSDDYIEENSVSLILKWISNNDDDICLLNGYKIFPNKEKKIIDILPKREHIKNKSAEEALEAISRGEKFPGSACTKIFKREFLNKNKLEFPVEMKRSEDLWFIIECFAVAKSFDYVDCDYYCYRQGRKNSITNSQNRLLTFNCLKYFVNNTMKIASQYPEKKIPFYRFAAYEYAILLNGYSATRKQNKKDEKSFFKDNKKLLKYGISKRLKVIRCCVALFGFNITSILLRLYMKIR